MINVTSGLLAGIQIGQPQSAQPVLQADTARPEPAPRYRIDPAMDFPVLIDDEDSEPTSSTPGYGVPMDGPRGERLDLRIPVPDRIPDALPPGQEAPQDDQR